MTAVTVRTERHRVLVEPARLPDPEAITTVQLGLAGAVVVYAVDDADATPAAEIHDVAAASWWLLSVYGIAVADAVAATENDGETRVVELAADAPLLDTVRRLGLALHLLRYWPAESKTVPRRLLPWLLRAEAGTLAALADNALDAAEGLAASLLRTELIAIAGGAALHHRRVGGSPADEAIDLVLLDAARNALDYVDEQAPGFTLLAELITRVDEDDRLIRNLTRGIDEAWAAQQQVEPDSSLRRRAREAVLLGPHDDDELLADGRQPVDPRVIRARVVASDDRAIRWEVRRSREGVRCDITVTAARDNDLLSPIRLLARVDHGGSVEAAALELGRDEDGIFYTGTVWLDATAPLDDLSVTVVGGVLWAETRPPRPDAERRRDRDAIDALVRDRLAIASQGVSFGWTRPFAVENLIFATVPAR